MLEEHSTLEASELGIWPDLLPALRRLKNRFDTAHDLAWDTTTRFCVAEFRAPAGPNPHDEYSAYLTHIKDVVGRVPTERHHSLLRQNTPPSILMAFFELYFRFVCVETMAMFSDLTDIGKANRSRFRALPWQWAHGRAKALIGDLWIRAASWITRVCDQQPVNPDDLYDFRFWESWQAPEFLMMMPSGHIPYDADSAWHRYDADYSLLVLNRCAEGFAFEVKQQLETALGDAAIQGAKEWRALPPIATVAPKSIPEQPAKATSRRELRKQNTLAERKKWQEEYRRLRRSKPELSDVQCSELIKKNLQVKQASDTIRKHMK